MKQARRERAGQRFDEEFSRRGFGFHFRGYCQADLLDKRIAAPAEGFEIRGKRLVSGIAKSLRRKKFGVEVKVKELRAR